MGRGQSESRLLPTSLFNVFFNRPDENVRPEVHQVFIVGAAYREVMLRRMTVKRLIVSSLDGTCTARREVMLCRTTA